MALIDSSKLTPEISQKHINVILNNMYTTPIRNLYNVQFSDLRKIIDGKFNTVHDELSDAYYGKKPFRTYGVLDKATFDKLHGLIFALRDIDFHEANKSLATKKIPESEYNDILNKDGEIVSTKTTEAQSLINTLEKEGITLTI